MRLLCRRYYHYYFRLKDIKELQTVDANPAHIRLMQPIPQRSSSSREREKNVRWTSAVEWFGYRAFINCCRQYRTVSHIYNMEMKWNRANNFFSIFLFATYTLACRRETLPFVDWNYATIWWIGWELWGSFGRCVQHYSILESNMWHCVSCLSPAVSLDQIFCCNSLSLDAKRQ